MKIEFTRTGGFAAPAMKQSLSLDTNDLSQAEANEVMKLVSDADLSALSAVPEAPPQPDEFHYRISVEDEGRNESVRASDSSMPETLVPLVDWLSNKAAQ